jgi:hypothetical protein
MDTTDPYKHLSDEQLEQTIRSSHNNDLAGLKRSVEYRLCTIQDHLDNVIIPQWNASVHCNQKLIELRPVYSAAYNRIEFLQRVMGAIKRMSQ